MYDMERNIRSLSICTMALAVGLFALLSPLRAVADNDDPPSRVARLSYRSGSISFEPAGTDDWVNAVVNRPITTGDKLWADDDSRAELHLGPASIRMSSHTGFSFLNLTDNTTQIQLTAGALRVRVKRLADNENFEIDTPNLAFSILRPGVYRVSVNEDGNSTIIKVRSGEGEVTGGGSAFTVHSREAATFNGTDELFADFNTPWDDDDDFDSWCADRDRHEDLSASRRYVSDDVIGYEDLDDYGGWRQVPEYGTVWFPHTTIVGWAPYRYGHWAYVYPWGYTWIDDAPWGFAPFHYGRWVNVGGVWGWVPCPPRAPGVVYVRPVYAPALVAWVGGPRFSVGVTVGGGGGGVGWFPLGPREVYVPSYPVSRTYITNVNVSNTTVNQTVINNYYNNTTVINRNTTIVNNNVQIHQTYINQSVPGAVTATTSQAFTSAQPVARNVIRVNEREVATAQVSAFTPAVAPAKQAVLGTGGSAAAKPPVVVQSRAVVVKETPPPPPVPFARQQQAIQANGGRPIGITQERQIQPVTQQTVQPSVKIAPPAKVVVPQNAQGGKPGQNNQPGQPFGGRGNNPVSNNPVGQVQNNSGNQPGQPSGDRGRTLDRDRGMTDRPPSAKPSFDRANNNGNAGGNAGGGGGGNANNNQPGQPSGDRGRTFDRDRGVNDRPPSARPSFDRANNSSGGGGNANNTPNNSGGNTNNNRGYAGGGGGNANNGPANPGEHRGNSGDNRGDSGSGNITPTDVKHQQELEQLHAKQDQDRQKLEQQQQLERQRLAQQAADERKQQELNQRHEQELRALQQQHDNQQQRLQEKQQQERHNNPPKDKKDDRPGKEDHPKGGDHPHDKS
jgi:hypothetical protein